MTDDEEADPQIYSLSQNGEEEEYSYSRSNSPPPSEDVTGKKSKKKKKSSKRDKSSSSSSSSVLPSLPLVSSIDISGSLSQLKAALFSATDISNTSPKAMMVRVVFLAILSISVIGIGYNYSLRPVTQQIAPVVEVEPEEIIIQKLPGKKSTKVNLAMEKEFGCRELQCVAQCNGKAKPKCLKSRSCVTERDKICLKRCRKTRCEDRCKDEPHLGYVEREQGLEKCKEACTGPTAAHNKCINKCNYRFKPCKTRCYEQANKFKCDNPKILAMAQETGPAALAAGSSKDKGKAAPEAKDDDEDFDGDSSLAGDEDEDDEGAPPPPPKKKSSTQGLDDDDLL